MKAIILDFDGVISDTEPVIFSVWSEYFQEKYEITINEKLWNDRLKGISSVDKADVIYEEFGVLISEEERAILFKKCVETMKIPGKIKLTAGVVDLLKEFSSCAIAIATGARLSGTLDKVKVLGIEEYFPEDRIFTIDDVERGKPYPDLFLYAADKMGVNPKDCIVVEDGIPGLKAAVAAGMVPIAYYEYCNGDTSSFIWDADGLKVRHICGDMRQVSVVISSEIWFDLVPKCILD